MHGVKFRIQDCPGFPYMGRDVQKLAGVMPLGTLTTRTATRTSKKKQKNNRFNKQNNFARALPFFAHFFACFARLRRENA